MISAEQLHALKRPLPVEQHEFLRGMVYLTEYGITERIEEVDPSWAMTQPHIERREETVEGSTTLIITVTIGITICDTTRYGVGMASTVSSEKTNKEVNEAEKSAATDALKRAARLFGIGRYLLNTPRNVDNHESLAKWLRSLQSPPHQQQQPKSQSLRDQLWANNQIVAAFAADRKKYNEWMLANREAIETRKDDIAECANYVLAIVQAQISDEQNPSPKITNIDDIQPPWENDDISTGQTFDDSYAPPEQRTLSPFAKTPPRMTNNAAHNL